jgi:hypothetical protein
MPVASEQLKRMAIVCVSAFVLVNIAFYLMSGSYFASHREIVVGVGSVATYTPEMATQVRTMFAVFAGVVAAFGFVAGLEPRKIGHLIPVLLGLADLGGAFGAFTHDTPAVLGMTLLVAGILLPTLAHFSYRGSRPAWAFLVAMCGVFALVEFFGAPKVSRALGISLWTAMILPGLNAVATAALASLRGSYVERSAS